MQLNDRPDFDRLASQTRLILDSYRRLLGSDLLVPTRPDFAAKDLFEAPFVVASVNAAADPILNYGNQKALDLWGLNWNAFTTLPGRRTAEAQEREARDRFLNEVRDKGYIRNYSGIRISSGGRRFRIDEAVVWNLSDASRRFLGQAVTFSNWEWL